MTEVRNVAASVHQRILNFAREHKEDFNLTLTKYALERLLLRLSVSKHKDLFTLKGALLFELWTMQRYRPTRDADFLATGDNSPQWFATIFEEICNIVVDTGSLRSKKPAEGDANPSKRQPSSENQTRRGLGTVGEVIDSVQLQGSYLETEGGN